MVCAGLYWCLGTEQDYSSLNVDLEMIPNLPALLRIFLIHEISEDGLLFQDCYIADLMPNLCKSKASYLKRLSDLVAWKIRDIRAKNLQTGLNVS